ncbi:MAG: hypothetical protein KF866_01985 [Phycisphaeraceae bacterium]|nr:hypothetical protein [Phycisphaeraceae bacterium]
MRTRVLKTLGVMTMLAVVAGGTVPLSAAQISQQATPRAQDRLLNIEWGGGTVGQYVRQVVTTAGEAPLNVILDPQVSGWQVLPLSLRQVSASMAIEVLETAVVVPESYVMTIRPAARTGESAAPVLAIKADMRPATRRPAEAIGVQVLSLRNVLSHEFGAASIPSEVVLSAIEAAIVLADNDGQPAQVRFHPDSNLLLIRGDSAEVLAATRAVELLEADVRRLQSQQSPHGQSELARQISEIAKAAHGDIELELIDLFAAMRTAEIETEQRARELSSMRDRVQEVRQLHHNGVASTVEVRNVMVEAERAEAQLQVARAQVDRIRQRIELLQQRATGGDARAALTARLEQARAQHAAAQARHEAAAAAMRVADGSNAGQFEQALRAAEKDMISTSEVVARLQHQLKALGPDPLHAAREELERMRQRYEIMERERAIAEVRFEELSRLRRQEEGVIQRLQAELAELRDLVRRLQSEAGRE